MATLPHPDKTWHQYGQAIHHYTRQQMLEYGEQCAADARKEAIDVRRELESYKEREKTMGWDKS